MEQRWHRFLGGEIIWKLFNGGIELELGFISHPSACLAFKVCARWTHITHWPTLKFDLSKRCRSNRVSAVTALSANAAFHAGFCWLAKRNVYFMMMSFPRASNSGGTRGECQWVAEPNVRMKPVSVTFAASDWSSAAERTESHSRVWYVTLDQINPNSNTCIIKINIKWWTHQFT